MTSDATFGPEPTTDEVLGHRDLTGTQVLVTGASAGLGLETTRALAARGATVIACVRDRTKAERAFAEVGIAGDRVEIEDLDLASLASVRAFTDRVSSGHDRLDVLFANAAVMACPYGHTADGFELQLGTNHLGHFVLVNRLVPLVLAAAPSRIVILTSVAHHGGDDLDDIDFRSTPYNEWQAYGRSKTANAQFAVELDRRLRDRGVRAIAVHPGGVATELFRHLDEDALELVRKARERPQRSPAEGAATQVWAGLVADPDEVGGRYVEDCHVAEVVTERGHAGVRPYVYDRDRAAALWSRSEELVGETFRG